MVISVAEMQQDWGELTQTFLSPDLPAAWLLTVWVLVTPKELWGGGGVGSKVGHLPRPEAHTPLLPGTSSLSAWSFGSLLWFPYPSQRHSGHLVKGKSV